MLSLTRSLLDPFLPESNSLLARAQAGDPEAFGEACRAYETRLLRQAMALCGNATLAEELTEDTLVEAWKCLRRYNGQCQFFTWLCAILLNRYRNVGREKRPLPFADFDVEQSNRAQRLLEMQTDPADLPDQKAQVEDQAALIRWCVKELPAKHQHVIYLRFFVDDSLEGIAAALGCSVGTVKSRLFHALERLRQMKTLANLSPQSSRPH